MGSRDTGLWSLSARRAWIEIGNSEPGGNLGRSLSARRAWIEISPLMWPWSPLKSLSARRAWIEITGVTSPRIVIATSLSARRAWIEIFDVYIISPLTVVSLSARRAWIEIPAWRGRSPPGSVALRKESVDRNIRCAVHRQKEKRRSPQGERG